MLDDLNEFLGEEEADLIEFLEGETKDGKDMEHRNTKLDERTNRTNR